MGRGEVGQRLWTRDFVLGIVVNFLVAIVFYLLMTTMALYAAERFGAHDSVAGLASSMFIVGATAARLFAGALVDLGGRRRVLLASLGVFTAASVAYIPAGSLGLLLSIRFVHGVAFGVASTATAAIAQGLIPPARRGEGTGYFGVSATLGTALGPLLALLLVNGPGYPALFTAAAVAGGLAVLVALPMRVPESRPEGTRRDALRRIRPSDLLDPAVLPIATFILVMGAAYSAVLTFLNSYAQQLDLAAGASSFFLVYAAVVFVARLIVGRIQDRRGDNIVIYPAIVAFAGGMLLLSRATGNTAVVVAGGLIGLGFGTLMSSVQAAAVAQVPPYRIGIAVSTFFFMLDIGTGLGPVFLGWLAQQSGYPAMYLVVAAVVTGSAGLYHLLHGRRPHARRGGARALEPAGAAPAQHR
ncbi:MAG: MFS transporter [Micromonosporaceae bacterium]